MEPSARKTVRFETPPKGPDHRAVELATSGGVSATAYPAISMHKCVCNNEFDSAAYLTAAAPPAPTPWRQMAAALGIPLQYHSDNIDAERQCEIGASLGAVASHHDVAAQRRARLLKACKGALDALGASNGDVRIFQFAQDCVLELQCELQRFGQLMCAVRGEAGETVLHYAYLVRAYDFASWLLDLEPMLFACSYSGDTYGGETALHILCAQHEEGSIAEVRKLARHVLHPLARSLAGPAAAAAAAAIAGGDRSGGSAAPPPWAGQARNTAQREADVERQRAVAWALLYARSGAQARPAAVDEKATSATSPAPPQPQPTVALGPEWSRGWLRAAWQRVVNSETYGNFFDKPPVGTCYYGGTPLSIAVVLDSVDVVRYLAVEVGCSCTECWESGEQPFYPGPLPIANELVAWDPTLCARIDRPDRYGNTAAHIAVLHHSRAHSFNLLSELYDRGYGRWNTAAVVAAVRARRRAELAPLPRSAGSYGAAARTPTLGEGASGYQPCADHSHHRFKPSLGQPQARSCFSAPPLPPAPPVFYIARRGREQDVPNSLLGIVNNAGLTPLTLAATLGKPEIFESMWVSHARPPEWAWGAIRAVCYPLDQIDDIGQVADDNTHIVSSTAPARVDTVDDSSRAMYWAGDDRGAPVRAADDCDRAPRRATHACAPTLYPPMLHLRSPARQDPRHSHAAEPPRGSASPARSAARCPTQTAAAVTPPRCKSSCAPACGACSWQRRRTSAT